jgi:hypothetical protein
MPDDHRFRSQDVALENKNTIVMSDGIICSFVMKTNLIHYLFIYFVIQPVHVSGVFIAHHQEVFTVYVQQLVGVMRLR